MNFVGKILTMLILVMSIFFCAFAVAVYATHKNWREIVLNDTRSAGKPLGLQQQLKKAKEDNEKVKAERDNLEARLTAEKDATMQALKKLENTYVVTVAELDGLRKATNGIDLERRAALARLKTTEDRIAALRREIEGDGNDLGLRKKIGKAEKEREQFFNEAVRLLDEKFQVIEQLRRLRDYQQTMRQDLDNAVAVLRKHGLKPVIER